MSEAGVLFFLNPAEVATIDALASRILPGDDDDPGAREMGASTYIDRALAGFAREQRNLYRAGLRELDDLCRERHGRPFRQLTESSQDALLAELDARHDVAADKTAALLFAVVREHVMQACFCDPAYGGNRKGAGWRLVGLPGARWGFSEQEMARDFDATHIPLTTLADLYAGDRSVG